MDTSSWRELDAGWRDRMVWLHDDYYFRRQEALWKANALRTLPVCDTKVAQLCVCFNKRDVSSNSKRHALKIAS
jgi:hypothetical protein